MRSSSVLFLLCLPLPLLAQQPPGCTTSAHRQFDFWVGDWTVTDSAGTTTFGTNRITNEESGCLIHEHWSGSRGGTGQSLNYYDLHSGRWVQVWVDSGGGNLRLEGALEDGRMVLRAVAPGPKGTTIEHHAIWSKEGDGRVRQYWRSSSDGGKTWQVVIDGWYRLRSG
jgi:hypothetical protein